MDKLDALLYKQRNEYDTLIRDVRLKRADLERCIVIKLYLTNIRNNAIYLKDLIKKTKSLTTEERTSPTADSAVT